MSREGVSREGDPGLWGLGAGARGHSFLQVGWEEGSSFFTQWVSEGPTASAWTLGGVLQPSSLGRIQHPPECQTGKPQIPLGGDFDPAPEQRADHFDLGERLCPGRGSN